MGYLTEEEYRSFGKEIIPGFLFLACHYEANDVVFLKANKIAYILNVAEECEPTAEAKKICKLLHLQLRDSPRTDLKTRFNEAFAFIDQALKANARLLVHCFEGSS